MALKVPFRPRAFVRPKKKFRYIIVHDINCQFGENEENFYYDQKRFQTQELRGRNFALTGDPELPYHFMIEYTLKDYESIICRPLSLMCQFEDIESPYDMSIHVGMMGSFSYNFPDNRYYKQMAFRCITPLMKLYRISINRVFLHHEVSTDKECNCPGSFFDKNSFISQLKPMMTVKG